MKVSREWQRRAQRQRRKLKVGGRVVNEKARKKMKKRKARRT